MNYDQESQGLKQHQTVNTGAVIGWGTVLLGFICLLIALGMWGCPTYNVWKQGLEGEAELKRAEQTRQVKIHEAMATKEAAVFLGEAREIKAKSIAAENKMIGESLKNNEAYLRYLWIEGLQDGSSEVIYIPTEAGLPILEAGRHLRK